MPQGSNAVKPTNGLYLLHFYSLQCQQHTMCIIFHCISKQSSVNAIWQFSLHSGSLPYWENVGGGGRFPKL